MSEPLDRTAVEPGDEARSDAPAEPGDRYLIREQHGRGGLGAVYRAHDRVLGRTVAIKELHVDSEVARARFEREARITARLEHPGIVPVHDAGRWRDGRAYYAMKLVSGRPLDQQIADAHTLDERLALVPNVLAVAEAIAYAHAEGVIHRDLKPSNIIIGAYGETVVIDWGLAKDLRATDAERADDTSADGGAEVTREGAVVGTPAYMPPEQARGETVDERADVYALGAALYHVITGAAPYAGATDPGAVLVAPPVAIEETHGAPEELTAIVAKAMARDPVDRYRDAAGFGDDLRRFLTGRLVSAHRYSFTERARRWVRRRRAALVAITMAALVGVGAWGLLREGNARPSCDVPPGALAGAWDSALRARARALFEATGTPGWSASFERFASELDRRAEGYRAMRREACVETHHRGVQTAAVLELRNQCLDRRRVELAALTHALADSDEVDPDRAVRAAYALPGLAACADAPTLSVVAPMPDDPAARAEVERAREQLEAIRARRDLGFGGAEAEAAGALVERVAALGYAPLEASARDLYAMLLLSAGAHERAVDAFHRAMAAAAAARDDGLLAEIEMGLLLMLSEDLRWLERAEQTMPLVAAQAERVSHIPRLAALWQETLGVYHLQRGEYDEAERCTSLAIEIFRGVEDRSPIEDSGLYGDLAEVFERRGEWDRAIDARRRSLALNEAAYGPDSPRTASALGNLAISLNGAGRFDESVEPEERSLTILRRAHGDDHPLVANAMTNLAGLLTELGQLERARELAELAYRIRLRINGPDHVKVAFAAAILGSVHLHQDHPDLARPLIDRALAIHEASLGRDHPTVVYSLVLLGAAQLAQGQAADAGRTCDRALAIIAGLEGDHPARPEAELCSGEALLAGRRYPAALARLEPLLASIDEAVPRHGLSELNHPWVQARLRFEVARALVATGRDRGRARDLAAAARDGYAAAGQADRAREVDTWIDAH